MRARAAVERTQAQDVGVASGTRMLRLGWAICLRWPRPARNSRPSEVFQHPAVAHPAHWKTTIADRREFYDASVNAGNVRIRAVPDIVIAPMLNFNSAQLLEFATQRTSDVNLEGPVPVIQSRMARSPDPCA